MIQPDAQPHRWMDAMYTPTRTALLDLGRLRQYPADAVLIEQDADPSQVMIIERGIAVVQRSGMDEHGIFVAFRGPHDLLGEIGVVHRLRRSAEVRASRAGPVRVWWYPADTFRAFLDDQSDARRAVDLAVLRKFFTHQERRARYTRGPTRQRVANVLLDALDDLCSLSPRGELVIGAPLTQQRIADLIGAGTDAVGRAFAALKDCAVIATTDGQGSTTTVLDRGALAGEAAGVRTARSGEGPRSRL